MELSKRDNYITVTRPVVSEDGYGDLTTTSETAVASFWGSVVEMKPKDSDLTFDNGRARFTRTIKITADSRDTEDVDIDDHLNLGSSEFDWEVTNLFEGDWKYTRTIIAQIKL